MVTPALVRRHVEVGMVFGAGRRRYVRVLRVYVNPPSVTVRRCTADGTTLTGKHRSGPLAGTAHEPFTVYLTWRAGRWLMPAAYRQEI